MASEDKAQPPFGPPDCVWKPMDSNTPVPETVVYYDGLLNGERAYVGRVYDGKCVLIGTAVPSKGVCLYLNKNNEVKSASSYEILTVDCGSPLIFQDMEIDHKLIFVAGCDENETLYVGRYIDDKNNTYYGWLSKSTRALHIPRDPKLGSSKIEKDFGVMIHRFLDRLCICPPCPYPNPGN